MKLYMLLIVGFALSVTACEKAEQAVPEQADEAPTTAPTAEPEVILDDDFVEHMHAHADQIDPMNDALADGDLDGAMTPAYWLARHESVSGVPADWQPYIVAMREAAGAVEKATDLESARAASKLITKQCQGCHTKAGILAEGAKQGTD